MKDGKITLEDFSSVWKLDNHDDDQQDDIKLGLREHLAKERHFPHWVKAKQILVDQAMTLLSHRRDIRILDLGCGHGLDLIQMAQAMSTHHISGTIVGLDKDPAMVDHAGDLVTQFAPGDVSFNVIQGDLMALHEHFGVDTFDLVRSDITVQRVGSDKMIYQALQQIAAVLKPGGFYVSLSSGITQTFTSDIRLSANLERIRVAQAPPSGGVAMQLFLHAMGVGLTVHSQIPVGFWQSAKDLQFADPNALKLKAMCQVFVANKLMTQNEADDHQSRYIQAIEANKIAIQGVLSILFCEKKKT